MAKTVASLAVSLNAKIGDFEKGFKKATRIASRFSSDLAGHVATVGKYGAAITGVALTAATALVKNQLEAVDATSKLSRTLGISTENLVGYQRAAELAGVDSDALAKAVFKLNKSTDAAFSGMSGDERLQAVADQYQALSGEVSRAQFLTKTFGKAGMELGPLFEEGAAGIVKAREETEKLRTSFASIEGVRVEAALDAFSTLQESVAGVARRISVELAPYIQVVAEKLTDVATQGNVTGRVVFNAFKQVADIVANLAQALSFVSIGWNAFKGVITNLASMFSKAVLSMISVWNKLLDTLGLDPNRNFEKMVADMVAGFDAATQSAGAAIDDAFKKLADGYYSGIVNKTFKEIAAEAERVKSTAGMGRAGSAADDAAATADAIKTAQFRQIDLNRVAVGGIVPEKDKGVSSKQGDTMISTLKQIATNTGKGMAIIT